MTGWLKNKVNIIRSWLNNNKIFFETIVALLLAVMAITLTIMSINVSEKANEIAFYETEITKMENQPIFRFMLDSNFIYLDNDIVPAKEQLIVSNIGKALKEIDCRSIIFLKITYWKNESLPEYALIPINDYYFTEFHTTNLTGELIYFQSHLYYNRETGNRLEIHKANNNFSEFAIKQNDNSGSIEILRFINVEYIDIFNNFHEEIYFVHPIYGSHKLNEEEKNTVRDYYTSFEYTNTFNILNLPPDIIYEKWLKNIKKSKKIRIIIDQDPYNILRLN